MQKSFVDPMPGIGFTRLPDKLDKNFEKSGFAGGRSECNRHPLQDEDRHYHYLYLYAQDH